VFYGRDRQPNGGVVMARTAVGGRTLAHVDINDAAVVAFLTDGQSEPIGTAGQITLQNGRREWHRQ